MLTSSRTMSTRAFLGSAIAAAALVLAATPATAATPSVVGTWKATAGAGAAAETLKITSSHGATFSGSATGGLKIHGTISGTHLRFTQRHGSYTATDSATLTATKLTHGTWKDSRGRHGTFTATRTSPTGPAAPSPRHAAANLSCTATSCTASVSDGSGLTPLKFPTGTVTLTSSDGTFPAGATCTLAASKTTGLSECTLAFAPSASATATPVIEIAYSGDATFAKASGDNQTVTY